MGGELDLLVAPIGGPVVARDDAGPMDPPEVAVHERVRAFVPSGAPSATSPRLARLRRLAAGSGRPKAHPRTSRSASVSSRGRRAPPTGRLGTTGARNRDDRQWELQHPGERDLLRWSVSRSGRLGERLVAREARRPLRAAERGVRDERDHRLRAAVEDASAQARSSSTLSATCAAAIGARSSASPSCPRLTFEIPTRPTRPSSTRRASARTEVRQGVRESGGAGGRGRSGARRARQGSPRSRRGCSRRGRRGSSLLRLGSCLPSSRSARHVRFGGRAPAAPRWLRARGRRHARTVRRRGDQLERELLFLRQAHAAEADAQLRGGKPVRATQDARVRQTDAAVAAQSSGML